MEFLVQISHKTEFSALINMLKGYFELAGGSESDLSPNLKGDKEISFEEFKAAAKKIAYVHDRKLQFVRELKLDLMLARRLTSGTLWDGLKGVKEMELDEIESACSAHSKDVLKCVTAEWKRIREEEKDAFSCKESADLNDFGSAMNKFRNEDGAKLGSFGTSNTFHGGLEARLGMADPQIFRAIVYEHVVFPDSKVPFLTSNYGIFTSPMIEFARVLGNTSGDQPDSLTDFLRSLGNKGPKEAEIKALADQFKVLSDTARHILERQGLQKFPGEIGDWYVELTADFQLQFSDIIDHVEDSLLVSCGMDHENIDAFFNNLGTDSFRENSFCLRGVHTLAASASNRRVCLHFYKDETQVEECLESIRQHLQESVHCTCQSIDQRRITISVTVVGQKRRCNYRDVQDSKQDSPSKLADASPAELTSILHISKQGRRVMSLRDLMQIDDVVNADLRLEEALVEYQYTGPLFQIWNSMLRKMMGSDPNLKGGLGVKENRYATTIHTLASAVIRTSRITKVPPNRRVYRGLGGMALDEMWSSGDKRGVKGGVEYGFLSTTTNKDVAYEYSGVKSGNGIVFEINVGAIDIGAELKSISQYPGENELLFGPLSNLEVVGFPRVEMFHGKPLFVIPLDININLKSQTIQELVERRKNMLMALVQNMKREIDFDISIAVGSAGAGTDENIDFPIQDRKFDPDVAYETLEAEWFNSDENFNLEIQNIMQWKRASLYQAIEHQIKDPIKALAEMARRGRADLVGILLEVQIRSKRVAGLSLTLKSAIEESLTFGHTRVAKQLITHLSEDIQFDSKLSAFLNFLLFTTVIYPVLSWVSWTYGGRISGIFVVAILGNYFLGYCIVLGHLVFEEQNKMRTLSADLGRTLHLASEKGFYEIVCGLLLFGASSTSKDEHGKTPLHYAVERGHIAIISLLVNARNISSMGKDDLVVAIAFSGFYVVGAIVYVYSNQVAGIIMILLGLWIMFWWLVKWGISFVKYRLRLHTVKNCISEHDTGNPSKKPLEMVPLDDKPLQIIAKALMDRRTFGKHISPDDAKIQNIAGKTALHLACECGFKDIVDTLVANSDCNEIDNLRRTPLHYVCHNTVQRFFASQMIDTGHQIWGLGARHGFKNSNITELWEDNLEIIEKLIMTNADADAKDIMERTPLAWALHSLSEVKFDSKKRITDAIQERLNRGQLKQ